MRKISSLEHTARQLVLSRLVPGCLRALTWASSAAQTRFRRSLAIESHVRGAGIEVGAAAAPAIVPVGCAVRYVDKYPIDSLRSDPELRGLNVRRPDIIASAETLTPLETNSQDFVIALSLLEHVQDALGTISTFYRVTRPGGSIVLSVPDKRRYGPDRERDLTTFEHFERDFREGPEWSRADHFREVGRVRHKLTGRELETFVSEKTNTDAHTHFHVWDPETFAGFLLRAKVVTACNYDLVELASYGHEALAVLKVIK